MIELLDYILDNDDNFWIISNITDGICKGYICYKVSDEGRYNHITKKYYTKEPENNGTVAIPKKFKRIFKPQVFYMSNKQNLKGIWKYYVDVLNEIGIEDENIGIFGSYLVGFDIIKDVDFVIYGKDNLHKYYENINYIKKKLQVTSISKEHAEYQYHKHKAKFSEKCDLYEIISRNWSGIELSNGILSTPRFIDKNNMTIPLKKGIDKVIQVKVIEGFYSVLLPREATVKYNNEIYKVYSTLWKFQSFAHKNDIIEIFGNVDDKNKLIIIDENKHYLNYLSKSDKIL